MSSPTIAKTITAIMGTLKTLKPNIKIKNYVKTESVLRHMIEDKTTSLQAVFDFDGTLTRLHKDGVHLDDSWTIIQSFSNLPYLLPIEYVKRTEKLRY